MLSICQAGANCRTGPSGYIQLHPSAAAATVTTTSQSSFTNRFLRAPVTSLCSSKQACKRTWVHRRASDEVDSNTASQIQAYKPGNMPGCHMVICLDSNEVSPCQPEQALTEMIWPYALGFVRYWMYWLAIPPVSVLDFGGTSRIRGTK